MADSPTRRPDREKPSLSDLNPMLNPVLEQNLDRWAQVYFGSPPEMREQAVANLLHELDRDPAHSTPPVAGIHATTAIGKVICPNCRHENILEHRFCGFCGCQLSPGDLAGSTAPRPAAARTLAEDDSFRPLSDLQNEPPLSVLGLSGARPRDKELDFLREQSFGEAYYGQDHGPTRGRFLFVLLAVVLAGITFWQWPWVRTQIGLVTESRATEHSTVPAPVTHPSAPQTEHIPSSPAAATTPSDAAATSAAPTAAQDISPAPDLSPKVSPVSSRPPVTIASNSALTPAAIVDGASELLQAKRYLQGRSVPRDPALAASWLWKSVSKQNIEAALLLADLYQRGEGVTKNCDQARLLLVAAAKKSALHAADKLRLFDAGGCR